MKKIPDLFTKKIPSLKQTILFKMTTYYVIYRFSPDML